MIFALIRFPSKPSSAVCIFSHFIPSCKSQCKERRSEWNELLCLMHKCKDHIIKVILKGIYSSLSNGEAGFINHNHKSNKNQRRDFLMEKYDKTFLGLSLDI